MIRVLLRESIATIVFAFAFSVVAFVALDATGVYDWWGTLGPGVRAGLPRDRALARDLPRLWNGRVADARVRTQDDLDALRYPSTRAAARARITHRGTAALPTLLARLPRLAPGSRDIVLEILATLAPSLTGGELPPATPEAALAYWERFNALRALEFRQTYARRLVNRLVDRDSRNAAEQLTRLGTFALPSIFATLEEAIDVDAARRLTSLVADITTLPLRIPESSSVEVIRQTVENWRAWWFAERLEYEQLTGTDHALAHVFETRYARWLGRMMTGRLATSRVTGRPVLRELRERLPASVFVAGLGGLLAIAFVVAFGGGASLRRRPWNVKALDLIGALVPGLVAFVFAFVAVAQLAAAPGPARPLIIAVLQHGVRLVPAVAAMATLAALTLRRRRARVTLHAVRIEAELWARESRHPKWRQVLRHGMRVGLSSLLAPMGLAAGIMVAISTLVEPLTGIHGMGDLTIQSILVWDPGWIMLSGLTVVPIVMGQRWARRVLVWSLGDHGAHDGGDGVVSETLADRSPEAPSSPDASGASPLPATATERTGT